MYRSFIKGRKDIWQEVISSVQYKKEGISKIIKSILIVSIPISLSALFSATTKTIDAITIIRFLKNIIGERNATIQYGILSGKVDTLITLPYSFNIAFETALIPAIATAITKKQINTAKRKIEFSILVTILIGLPCSICMSIFSKQILELLFPNAMDGDSMLRVSAWTIIFVVLTQTINGSLQGMGKVWTPVIAFGLGAVVKLIGNILLIPLTYINGAIISSIISHFVSFIICYIVLTRNIKLSLNIGKFLIKPTIASILMGMSSYIIYKKLTLIIQSNISLIISLTLGVIMYIIMILVLKIVSKEEFLMIPYGQRLFKALKR